MAIKAYPVSVQTSPNPVVQSEGCPAPNPVPNRPNKARDYYNFLVGQFK